MKPFEKIIKEMKSPLNYVAVQFYGYINGSDNTFVVATPLTSDEVRSFIKARMLPNDAYFFAIKAASEDKGFVARQLIKRKLHCIAELETINLTEFAKIITIYNEMYKPKEVWWRITLDDGTTYEVPDTAMSTRPFDEVIEDRIYYKANIERFYK